MVQGGAEELPAFVDGVLPPGDYELALESLRKSHLVTGGGQNPWDEQWRGELVGNLKVLVGHLVAVGIKEVFADGSFAEDKPHPSDIDGYFVVPDANFYISGDLQRALAQIDSVWTWDPASRTFDPSTGKKQLPMWHRYHVELYPHCPGLLTGIHDQYGNELEFPAAFRLSRGTWKPRGIIRIGGL